MKKTICLALALLLALTLSASAFATTVNPNTDHQADTTVTYAVAPSYNVSIPETVTISSTLTGKGTLQAQQVRLLEGQTIEISLDSDSDFHMRTGADGQYLLPYTVTVEGETTPIASGDTVATFTTTSGVQSVRLIFGISSPTYAGSYSDTVTFTVKVVDP